MILCPIAYVWGRADFADVRHFFRDCPHLLGHIRHPLLPCPRQGQEGEDRRGTIDVPEKEQILGFGRKKL